MSNYSSCQKISGPRGDRFLAALRRASIFLGVIACLCAVVWSAKSYGLTAPNIMVKSQRIASFDGVHLQGLLFTPEHAADGAPLPAVILVGPWALPSAIYMYQAKRLAQSGFVVLAYTARGFGFSEGESSVGGRNDIEDMGAWIDWLIANAPIDPERIGACGISLGAGIVMISAAHDERIKAVSALSGWSDLYTTLYHQQTAPRLWGDLLVISGKLLGRVEKSIETMFGRLRNYDISSQEIHAWADPRSPINYLDVYEARGLPIYMQHNMGDNLFEVNQTIDFYRRLNTPHKKLDLNFGEHITAELLSLAGFNPVIWDRVIAWFGLYLRDEHSALLDEPRVGIPVHRSARMVRADEWPRTASDSLYLGSGETLDNTPPASTTCAMTTIKSAWLPGASAGIPVISTAIEAQTGIPAVTLKQLMFRDKVALFSTPRLLTQKTLVGMPKIELWVSSSSPTVQLVAYLYSVNALGMAYPITHGAVTIHDTMTSLPQKVSFEMQLASYAVPQGSSLMLAIDTFDLYYASPKTAPYTVNFGYGGGGCDARVELPFLTHE